MICQSKSDRNILDIVRRSKESLLSFDHDTDTVQIVLLGNRNNILSYLLIFLPIRYVDFPMFQFYRPMCDGLYFSSHSTSCNLTLYCPECIKQVKLKFNVSDDKLLGIFIEEPIGTIYLSLSGTIQIMQHSTHGEQRQVLVFVPLGL